MAITIFAAANYAFIFLHPDPCAPHITGNQGRMHEFWMGLQIAPHNSLHKMGSSYIVWLPINLMNPFELAWAFSE